MKKVFLIMSALCCLLAAPAIRAQNLNEWAPNEISASYGVSLLGSSINTLIDLAGTFSRVAEADAPTIKSGGSRGKPITIIPPATSAAAPMPATTG